MDHPTIPAEALSEPTDMRGKIECALVAGMNAKETIGTMAIRILSAMRTPTESMKGYAKHRCHIGREQAHEVWYLMIQEALYGDSRSPGRFPESEKR